MMKKVIQILLIQSGVYNLVVIISIAGWVTKQTNKRPAREMLWISFCPDLS